MRSMTRVLSRYFTHQTYMIYINYYATSTYMIMQVSHISTIQHSQKSISNIRGFRGITIRTETRTVDSRYNTIYTSGQHIVPNTSDSSEVDKEQVLRQSRIQKVNLRAIYRPTPKTSTELTSLYISKQCIKIPQIYGESIKLSCF